MQNVNKEELITKGYTVKRIEPNSPRGLVIYYTFYKEEALKQYAMSEAESWDRAAFHSTVCNLLSKDEELAAWLGLAKLMHNLNGTTLRSTSYGY